MQIPDAAYPCISMYLEKWARLTAASAHLASADPGSCVSGRAPDGGKPVSERNNTFDELLINYDGQVWRLLIQLRTNRCRTVCCLQL